MGRSAKKEVSQSVKCHPHEDAARLAGEVFGKILDREADRGGYEYVLYCLEGGIKSVQQIVLDFISSDEFIDKFTSYADAGQTANLVTKILLGEPLETEAEMQTARYHLVRFGLRAYAEQIMLSQEYQAACGPDQVPGMGH
jgi:uncharacterized protein (DUF1330 family)